MPARQICPGAEPGKNITLMRTSWALGGATSASSSERGFRGSQATAALHLMTWNGTIQFTPFYLVSFYNKAHDLVRRNVVVIKMYWRPN